MEKVLSIPILKGLITIKTDVGPDSTNIALTEKGREVRSVGGIFAFDIKQKTIKELEGKREALSDAKLETDLRNARRIYKAYYWSFGLSIAAFLISLLMLLRENHKKTLAQNTPTLGPGAKLSWKHYWELPYLLFFANVSKKSILKYGDLHFLHYHHMFCLALNKVVKLTMNTCIYRECL